MVRSAQPAYPGRGLTKRLAVGGTFWFRWNQSIGSYAFLTVTSRASLAPNAASTVLAVTFEKTFGNRPPLCRAESAGSDGPLVQVQC